jgi:flagellar biosynthesis component FlhA
MTSNQQSLSLTLQVSPPLDADLENYREQLGAIRDRMFDNFGLIIPPIVVQADQNLTGNSFQLLIDGRSFAPVSDDMQDFQENLLKILQQQAGQLLKPDLVNYYLMRLATSHPQLVAIVHRRFELDSLTKALSARLQAGTSIKDFIETLEVLLSESIGQH